jgi:hypothetical protein
MNKKILFILGAVLLAAAIIAMGAWYQFSYLPGQNAMPQNQEQQENPQENPQQNIENNNPANPLSDVEVETQGGNVGGLFVCSDKCGDGICQQEIEKDCKNLNCTCVETKTDCPQDCK